MESKDVQMLLEHGLLGCNSVSAAEYKWGTVMQQSPLRIKVDGDTTWLPYAPPMLNNVIFAVGDRVFMGLVGNQYVVHGRLNAEPFVYKGHISNMSYAAMYELAKTKPGTYLVGQTCINQPFGKSGVYGNLLLYIGSGNRCIAEVRYDDDTSYSLKGATGSATHWMQNKSVVAEGSSINWYKWIKYSDGTAKLLGNFSKATSTGGAWANGYIHSWGVAAYPFPFLQPPAVQISGRVGTGTGIQSGSEPITTAATIALWCSQNKAAFSAQAIVEGMWK